jgi:hypothetical protein
VHENSSRRELLSTVAKAVPLAAVAAAAVGDRAASAAPKGGNSATALVSSFDPAIGGFVGTLTVNRVAVQNGVLMALGSVTGNVVSTAGTVVGTTPVTQAIATPLQVAGSCQILNLVLGPLDLNLLGLTIHLNQVVLNITAVPGAGNLLGNLLCAVANLLNGGGALQTLLNNLVTALNQILAAL